MVMGRQAFNQLWDRPLPSLWSAGKNAKWLFVDRVHGPPLLMPPMEAIGALLPSLEDGPRNLDRGLKKITIFGFSVKTEVIF